MPANSVDLFTQHYLEIEALTPVDQAYAETPQPHVSSWYLTLPFIAIIGLFIGLFAWQFFHRLKDFNRTIMVLLVGFVIGSIPLALNFAMQRQTQVSIKAVDDFTPQAVVVDLPTPQSVQVSWRTKVPTLGAVRVASSPTMRENLQVTREASSTLIHQVTVTNLKPATTYHLEVFSDSKWYNHFGLPLIITTTSLP